MLVDARSTSLFGTLLYASILVGTFIILSSSTSETTIFGSQMLKGPQVLTFYEVSLFVKILIKSKLKNNIYFLK